MAQKKVAFLIAGVNAGGTENYLLRFIKYYHKEIEATVYCKSGKLGELEDEFINAGAHLVPFYLGYFNYGRFSRLRKEFENKKFDSVCDLTGSFGAFPLMVAKSAGIENRISFFRNSGEKFQKSAIKSLYHYIITKLLPHVSTSVLSNSKAALNHFYKGEDWSLNNKFQVVYNGIDSRSFIENNLDLRDELGLKKDSFVVGHVGRYNEQKNHDTIVKVAINLCKEDKDIYFILCGKNVQEAYYQKIVEHGLGKQILFLGVRRDINKVLRTMNCFYFPSTIEGQPNALIEALMVGLPFVCSNIEPIKETIPKEFYGQLIPPFDYEQARLKILDIKNDSKKRDSLNLSNWAINYYDPAKWFQMVYDKL